ncbi:MFS general substrate transporter [Aspergillus campestris IBT 28561]|uniref:MFS general substrate transporter n=1 Tax=Aspergillus campestris (strain IBT 28561) TaxID=1392248 RepID=A0A2I1DCW8_ASPC2|nr:MFS general substrate transporter [Aspergillus campestris IBT 28561]PKY07711.1 MFS general substrate transporter [Aspergillus campestris IBT 28561]
MTNNQAEDERPADAPPENDHQNENEKHLDRTTSNEYIDEEAGLDSDELSRTATNATNVSRLAARTLSLVRTRESGKDIGPPPDGGFTAWSQVALAHFVIFNTWGYINSFGVFQSYYTEALDRPPSDISWVGSIQIFLLFFIGTFSGRATDAGYFKAILTAGALLEVFCIFMTSLCTEYWQLFLAQGIGQGIGCGLMFCPTIALMPTYFTRKRALAIGITASGSATGGLVFPAVVMRLLPQLGFGWTMRVLGFISLATLTPCLVFLKQRLPPRRSGPLVEWGAFRELPYTLFAIGMFLNFWGIYVGFFYIGSFSRNMIGVSQETSIDVILVMNGIGLLGRLGPNYLADRFTGPLNMLLPFSLATGVISYCWSGVDSVPGLYAWSAFYGLAAAGIQSLFPATLSTLTTDLKKTGVRMGMVLSVVGVAALIGSPIAGALVEKADGHYLYAQMFMGTVIVAGMLTLSCARLAKLGWNIRSFLSLLIPAVSSPPSYNNPSPYLPDEPLPVYHFLYFRYQISVTLSRAHHSIKKTSPIHKLNMAPRGRGGKFSKPSRGGGKHFSRDVQPVDKNGNPVGLWRDPEDAIPSSSEGEDSSQESSSEDEDEAPTTAAGSSSAAAAAELTREERRAAAKAKKRAAIARKNQVQPGDLPSSDEEDDDADNDNTKAEGEGDLPANPNHTAKSRSQLEAKDDDDENAPAKPAAAAAAGGGDLSQLSRREREAIEAQQERERYMKLHAEGKTNEARADLARLAIVREQREAERARKEAEKEEKAELAKQRVAEREAKLQKGGKKGNKKK